MSGDPATGRSATGGRRKRRVVTMRVLRFVAVVLVLALAVAAVIAFVIKKGPPSEQELLERARLTDKLELRVGVKDDIPGVALRDKGTGQYSGFDIDIAYMVASDLGFRGEQPVNLPQEIAEDRQPDVPPVKVRQWPWDKNQFPPTEPTQPAPSSTQPR